MVDLEGVDDDWGVSCGGGVGAASASVRLRFSLVKGDDDVSGCAVLGEACGACGGGDVGGEADGSGGAGLDCDGEIVGDGGGFWVRRRLVGDCGAAVEPGVCNLQLLETHHSMSRRGRDAIVESRVGYPNPL